MSNPSGQPVEPANPLCYPATGYTSQHNLGLLSHHGLKQRSKEEWGQQHWRRQQLDVDSQGDMDVPVGIRVSSSRLQSCGRDRNAYITLKNHRVCAGGEATATRAGGEATATTTL
ncbi:uncharacterized protein DS421_11g338330 [Arachis hypogaea]|nr:uncharacterized protein DS421_11g338330 [Arachis hypogaea]